MRSTASRMIASGSSSMRSAAGGTTPTSIAMRRSRTARQQSGSGPAAPSASGGSGNDERAAGATAQRGQMPALDERLDGLAQRRTRDPELLGELALGRQARAGGEDAQAD